MIGFTIVICTRDRVGLLKSCLDSVLDLNFEECLYEIIIVDNGSVDDTAKFIKSIVNKNVIIKYVYENRPGLSIARNVGINMAKSEWIIFLDDDARVNPDFLSRYYKVLISNDFAGIGGLFTPWFSKGEESWIPNNVVQFPILRTTLGPLNPDLAVPGGICSFSKKWLEKVGCFPEKIGMKGEKVGYGEENYLQKKIWEAGGEIWFDPLWKIEHYVAPYKYKISWHIKRLVAKGRDFQLMNKKLGIMSKIYLLLKLIIAGFYLSIKNLWRFMFSKSYKWQSWFLDSFSYSLQSFGKIVV